MITLFAIVLSLISIFLILLVLVQRGRGGGLTGALGGMGGQSAFGTKAGDTFTRITIVAATVWILVAILALKVLSGSGGKLGDASAADVSGLAPAAAGTEADGSNTDPATTGIPGIDLSTPGTGAEEQTSSPPAEANPSSEE